VGFLHGYDYDPKNPLGRTHLPKPCYSGTTLLHVPVLVSIALLLSMFTNLKMFFHVKFVMVTLLGQDKHDIIVSVALNDPLPVVESAVSISQCELSY